MARARNIKPGFFTNDILAECDPLARIMFQGLWCHADRDGRLEDRPRKLKAEILPYDDCDADALIEQLAQRGFVIRYQHGSSRFIQIVNFDKHQNPHQKEPASTIPAPDKTGACSEPEQVEPVSSPADSLNLIPLTLNPQPEKKHAAQKPRLDISEGFDDAWDKYPKRPGASRADSLKAWKARIKEGVSISAMTDGVIRYAEYCRSCCTPPEFIKQPATFFGVGRHFESDWTPSKKSPSEVPMEDRRYGEGGRL